MRYFTLLTLVDGVWCIEFGDYDRSTVKAEKDDLHYGCKRIPLLHLKIIETSDLQADIQAQVDLLNEIPSQPKSETVDI